MNDKHRWDNNPREYNYIEYRRVDSVNRIVAKVYKSGLRGEWVYGPSSYLSQEDAICACEKDFPTEADTPAQPQYREPTLADAHNLYSQFLLESNDGMLVDDALRTALKINGFVKKVQP